MKEMNNIPFPKIKKIKSITCGEILKDVLKVMVFVKTPVPYPLTEFDLANRLAILGMKEGWGIDSCKINLQKMVSRCKEPATEPNISEICAELKIDKDKTLYQKQMKMILEKNTILIQIALEITRYLEAHRS